MAVLDWIQAGVLKPDGRDFRNYVFIRLNDVEDFREKTREFVGGIAADYVTSHRDQEQDTKRYKQYSSGFSAMKIFPLVDKFCFRFLEEPVFNLGLSRSGFEKIANQFSPFAYPSDSAFRVGMRGGRSILFDYNAWQEIPESLIKFAGENPARLDFIERSGFVEDNYRRGVNAMLGIRFQPIDMVITVGHSKKKECQVFTDELISELEKGKEAGLVQDYFVEKGFQRRDKATRNPLTPLNYQEGFSNTITTEQLFDKVLVREDWWVEKGDDKRRVPTYGTYMAFRKIQVREPVFEDLISELVLQLQPFNIDKTSDELREYAYALYMGRFRDGTPLSLSDKPLAKNMWRVNGQDIPFDYQADVTGSKCPIGAHIRRMNPRGSGKSGVNIVRRSMRFDDVETARSGLLFVSYQGSITKDFEPLFERMRLAGHSDPIAYRPEDKPSSDKTKDLFDEFTVPAQYGKSSAMINVATNGYELTSFRGGEYFFLPSIAFLNGL